MIINKLKLLSVALALAASTTSGGEDLARWVDPFVGTSGTGHTFPAACVPFGLVQSGPDTGNGSWDYCSGYRYDDKTICGFTQTHLNGTGCMDLGDVRILPTSHARSENKSVRKLSEAAKPGYYAAELEGGIKVEIAAAEHSAIYRISGKGNIRLLVDCAYGVTNRDPLREITKSDVVLMDKTGLSGCNHRRKWVERDYGFAVAFARECDMVEELPRAEGQVAPQYLFDFDMCGGESPLLVKIALSAGGGFVETALQDAAKRNLEAEIPGWDFEAVKNAARAKWNEVLGRATIEGTDDQKRNWYTSLYHLFIQPNNIADVGGKPFYSTFSCWDTFRAAHPLYTILAPDKASEFVDSMLEQGRRTGHLPIWTLWGKDNQCMIGTHSVPVIVDWFLKEVGGVSSGSRKEGIIPSPTPTLNTNSSTQYWLSAYAQIKDTLTKPHAGRMKERWDLLDKFGYYPFDVIKGESVSRTLECAYDDWCAGMMARELGERGTGNRERDESLKADAEFFFRRSGNWRNVFDPSIGLVRGKDSQGRWRSPYNPFALGHGDDLANDFTEGNAFQYTWHVMQDPQGLVAAMGGRDAFVKKLDQLFSQPETVDGAGCVLDVTGLIGQYVHGNEPSHHVIYFYPQVGCPEKAAERIREVFDKFYIPRPDGLCGNDDCGQMSAWYLFSAMGFYPFNPCGGEYVIGAPQVSRVRIKLETKVGVGERTDKFHSPTQNSNSNYFTILAKNLTKENKYVKSVTLNGKPITDWKLRHSDIVAGGELVFEMCAEPPLEAVVGGFPVGDVKLECPEPIGWSVDFRREAESNGVEYAVVEMQREEPGFPPVFGLTFDFAKRDIVAAWRPWSECAGFGIYWDPKNLPDAGRTDFRSWLPLYACYSSGGSNRMTFASSETAEPLTVRAGIREEDNRLCFAFRFYGEKVAKRSHLLVKLRIDARNVFWSDAVGEAADWMSAESGRVPAQVPDAAFAPLYSTWYAFHQDVRQDEIEQECELASKMGMGTIIVDDGWQTDDTNRGYAFCGDWTESCSRFPDIKAHVKRVHSMGMKYMLWYSVPFIGDKSANAERFKGKFLYHDERLHTYCLDPRFPDVRDFLISTYERAVRDWGVDGVKLDFIDSIKVRGKDPAIEENYKGRDMKSVSDATERLVSDIYSRLSAVKKDVLIEFRQSYIGPSIRTAANMLRVGDCPADMQRNRCGIVNLRLTSGKTAVHSDMLEWHPDDTPEAAAKNVLCVMFSTVQYSMKLSGLDKRHADMIGHWSRFGAAHCGALQRGRFRAYHPELAYPLLEGESDSERIFGVYAAEIAVASGTLDRPVYVLNATDADSLVVEIQSRAAVEAYDTYGVKVSARIYEAGCVRMAAPPSGYVVITGI